MSFSLPEKIIFLVAAGAPRPTVSGSASARWSRKIRAAKPDADFSLHPIGKRVWDFVWEVLLQAKVIRERPLPGLAHAFVFWGFCVFALITLNHFATGFGFPIPATTWFGDAYFDIRAHASACSSRSRICGSVHPAFLRAPALAGRAVEGIRRHRVADFRADGHLSLRVPSVPAIRKAAVVGAYAGAAGVSAADPAHQASAPGAQPGHGISFARRDSATFRRSWATRISGSTPARI